MPRCDGKITIHSQSTIEFKMYKEKTISSELPNDSLLSLPVRLLVKARMINMHISNRLLNNSGHALSVQLKNVLFAYTNTSATIPLQYL